MSDHKYIPGSGPLGCRIMILGECPTPDDVNAGRPFSRSMELNRLLTDVGIQKPSCWLTTVSNRCNHYIYLPNIKSFVQGDIQVTIEDVYRKEVLELRVQFHNMINELAALVAAAAEYDESQNLPSGLILEVCKKYLDRITVITQETTKNIWDITNEITNSTPHTGNSER